MPLELFLVIALKKYYLNNQGDNSSNHRSSAEGGKLYCTRKRIDYSQPTSLHSSLQRVIDNADKSASLKISRHTESTIVLAVSGLFITKSLLSLDELSSG